MLAHKCLHVREELSIVGERDTTKTYHTCKRKKGMPLHIRTYHCENYGLVTDRDDKAVNIYERSPGRLGATHP